MSYQGNTPADKFQTLQKQSFTTSATDTYTLSYSVTNPQDLGLFINNVRQNPNDAYTVSGTTLTLSSAITSSDSMYAVFLGRAVETVAPAIGSVTNDMLANSSITLNGSAVSLGGSATVGETNTPNFSARINSTQSIPSITETKIQTNNEEFDSDNAFDHTTNYRFTVPSGKGGKYLIGGQVEIDQITDANRIELKIYKNGSEHQQARNVKYAPKNVGREVFIQTTTIIDLSVGDYVELYVKQTDSSTRTSHGSHNRFYGFKLVE